MDVLEERVCDAEAKSKRQSVLEDSMGSLKNNASQTDAHLREIEARILKLEPLMEKRVCDAEAFSKRQSALEDSMGSLKSNASQSDAHLCQIEARILKLEPLLEKRVCDAEAFSKRQSDLEDSMGSLKNNASRTDAHLREIEARILKLEPLLEKRVCDAEAFSKRQSALEDSMGSLKSNASQSDAHLCQIEARILKLEPLMEKRVCDAEAFSKRQSALEDSMGSLKSNASQSDAHLCQIEARILKLEPLMEERVCDAEAFSKRQSDLEDSMGSLKNNASQTDAHLREIEARIFKLEPLLADQKLLITLIERMERDVSDLDQRISGIASADGFQFNLVPKIDEKLHYCQNQIKELEAQVSSLKNALQNKSAGETSQDAHKLGSPTSVAPAFAAVHQFADEKIHLDDATPAQRLPVPLASSQEVLARRPRSASMPKATIRQPFMPMRFPRHPEDETSRRRTLQVEEELQNARKSNAPLDVRKKKLKDVLLRCAVSRHVLACLEWHLFEAKCRPCRFGRLHSDKIGGSSEPMMPSSS